MDLPPAAGSVQSRNCQTDSRESAVISHSCKTITLLTQILDAMIKFYLCTSTEIAEGLIRQVRKLNSVHDLLGHVISWRFLEFRSFEIIVITSAKMGCPVVTLYTSIRTESSYKLNAPSFRFARQYSSRITGNTRELSGRTFHHHHQIFTIREGKRPAMISSQACH